jgi:hypothetical protein
MKLIAWREKGEREFLAPCVSYLAGWVVVAAGFIVAVDLAADFL